MTRVNSRIDAGTYVHRFKTRLTWLQIGTRARANRFEGSRRSMGLEERNKPTMAEGGRSRADRDEWKRNLPKGKRGPIGRQLRKVRNRPDWLNVRTRARVCYPVRFDRCESTVIRESSRSDLFFSPVLARLRILLPFCPPPPLSLSLVRFILPPRRERNTVRRPWEFRFPIEKKRIAETSNAFPRLCNVSTVVSKKKKKTYLYARVEF